MFFYSVLDISYAWNTNDAVHAQITYLQRRVFIVSSGCETIDLLRSSPGYAWYLSRSIMPRTWNPQITRGCLLSGSLIISIQVHLLLRKILDVRFGESCPLLVFLCTASPVFSRLDPEIKIELASKFLPGLYFLSYNAVIFVTCFAAITFTSTLQPAWEPTMCCITFFNQLSS